MRCVRRDDGELVYYYPDLVKVRYSLKFEFVDESGEVKLSFLELDGLKEGVEQDWVRCRISDFITSHLADCKKAYRPGTPVETEDA